jgi:hypothetical protein
MSSRLDSPPPLVWGASPAKQKAHCECDASGRVRPGFDKIAHKIARIFDRPLSVVGDIGRRILCLAIEVLGRSFNLARLTAKLCFGVASKTAEIFLDFAANILGRTCYPIIGHGFSFLGLPGQPLTV